jgi:hypothetical protein
MPLPGSRRLRAEVPSRSNIAPDVG